MAIRPLSTADIHARARVIAGGYADPMTDLTPGDRGKVNAAVNEMREEAEAALQSLQPKV